MSARQNIVVLLALLCAPVLSYGQASSYLAPQISFEYGSPLFINRDPGVLNHFGLPGSGHSQALSYGIGVQWISPSLFAHDLGLRTSLRGAYTTARFDLDGGYTITGIDRKIEVEAAATYDLRSVVFSVGPWTAFSVSSNVSEIAPGGSSVHISNSKAAPFHFVLGAGITMPLGGLSLEPTAYTHLDLSQMGKAGSNAWSFGIALAYSFSRQPERSIVEKDSIQDTLPVVRVAPARVRFLVNQSELNRDVPLVRDELREKQYEMVDSPNVAPQVTQWSVLSYHLPKIAVSCEFDRDERGVLTLLTDSIVADRMPLDRASRNRLTFDTTISIEERGSWQDAVSRLDINRANRIDANLEVLTPDGKTLDHARDSLLLPPVDSAKVLRTVVKKQYRFFFSSNYASSPGQNEALELLLRRVSELADSASRVTMECPAGMSVTGRPLLEKKILDALPGKNPTIERSNKDPRGIWVILDL